MNTNGLNGGRMNYTALNFSGNSSRKASVTSEASEADVWLWDDGSDILWSDSTVIPTEEANYAVMG